MTLPQGLLEPDINAAVGTTPFAAAAVNLSRLEHGELVREAAYWSVQFHRWVARETHRERRYRRLFDQLKAHGARREARGARRC